MNTIGTQIGQGKESSTQEIASEIKTLQNESDRLSRSVDRWNNGYVWFGAIGLLIAFLVFLAQFLIIKRGRQLSGVQTQLLSAKDRQSALDSGEKDRQIAALTAEAKSAESKIASAQDDAGKANQKAGEANAKAEGFRADIAKANEGSAKAQAQVAGAQLAAAEANRVAESERFARLQLEAKLADRVITASQASRLKLIFAPLKGETVDVVVVGDSTEITNTMSAISNSINAVGVLLNFFHPASNTGARGVLIGARKGASVAEKQACTSLVLILSETLGNGVAEADFDALDNSKSAGTAGATPGAAALWSSPIRLLVASK